MATTVCVTLLQATCLQREDAIAFAERPAPCSTDDDCCVVVDQCAGVAFVVGEGDFEEAQQVGGVQDFGERCVSGCFFEGIVGVCEDGECAAHETTGSGPTNGCGIGDAELSEGGIRPRAVACIPSGEG